MKASTSKMKLQMFCIEEEEEEERNSTLKMKENHESNLKINSGLLHPMMMR